MNTQTKITWHCPECGSTDVRSPEWCRFDVARQEWIGTGGDTASDDYWCEQCQHHTRTLDTREATPDELNAARASLPGEPLSVAYLAIGAHSQIRGLQTRSQESDAAVQSLIDQHGGELGLIGAVVGFAGQMDSHYTDELGFAGVWAYEVAEELGARLVSELAAGVAVDAAAVDRIVRQLIEG